MVKRAGEKCRRAGIMMLLFFLLLSGIPGQIYGAAMEKGDEVTISEGKELIGADGKPYYLASGYYTARFSNSSGTGFDYRVCLATTSKNTLVINNGKTRYQGYCLEHGAWMNPGSTAYKATVTQLETLYWLKPYSADTIRWIELALLFGKQPNMTQADVPVDGCNLDDWYFATQNIIWEFQQGLRTSPSAIRSNPKTQPANWYSKTMKGRPAYKMYTWMLEQMGRYDKVQSFAAKKRDKAPLLNLTDNGDGTWSGTFRDTKKVAQDIRANNEHVQITRSGNEYTITTDVDPAELGVVKCRKNVKGIRARQPLLAFTTGQSSHISNHLQSVVWGASDPVELFIRLGEGEKPQEGEGPEPELPEFHLDISKIDQNPGFDGRQDTGMGDAALNAGVTVTVDAGSGETEEFIELNEYGKSEGFTFAPWLDVSQLQKAVTADDEHTYVTYTAEAEVTVEETSVPEGRYEESTENGAGRRSHHIRYFAQSVDNAPFVYRIEADGQTYTEIGQETLQLKEDRFINDNFRGSLQIIKTKTDLDPFTENSEGVTGTEGSASDTGEGSETVSEGKYSTKSLWTVRLVSDGYEECPYVRVVPLGENEKGYDSYAKNYRVVRTEEGVCADENNPLTVSSHGRINLTDLPYGTYEVCEIAADSPGYVLESFVIRITDAEQKISVTAQNIPKRNKIKIVKVNSETGKTVRLEGAVFRLKYLGNPDSADPEKDKNYGRYLPNGADPRDGSDYIFSCNENGEIALPYPLEYGTYQLEELIVPEGYFVGDYDDVREFNAYTFSVKEQDAHKDGEEYTTYYVTVDMENKPVKGSLSIEKKGEFFAGWQSVQNGAYTIFQAVWEQRELAGAEFAVYAAEDIEQIDGVKPVRAFFKDGRPVELQLKRRDHSEKEEAEEIREASLPSGGKITQTSEKAVSDKNKTVTVYEVSQQNKAFLQTTFSREENGIRRTYLLECEMRYSPGGMNYTDIHVKREAERLDGTQEDAPLLAEEPVVTYGGESLPLIDVILQDDSRIIQHTDNRAELTDEQHAVQEYDFELVQHFQSDQGFTFSFDGMVIHAEANPQQNRAQTVISGILEEPQIQSEGAYTYTKKEGSHVFTASAQDDFPLYFLTNDGIKTEMKLAAGLTHTRLTVPQKQLFSFDGTYPKLTYKGSDIDWSSTLKPDKDTFVYTIDGQNYVKACRHERSPENEQVYYTVDIVSNGDEASGFTVVYPDSTRAVPTLQEGTGRLIFTAVDDTLIYPIGSPVRTVTTDEQGNAVMENLPLGKYYVRETASVSGQVNRGEWKAFELLYQDQSTPVVWHSETFTNEAVEVKIDLSKLFQASAGSSEYVSGSGAVFGIYTAEANEGAPAGALVGTMTVTDSRASAQIKLPMGRYYLQEISAAPGYMLNPNRYYFTAADVLSSDELRFHYKGEGISGTVTAEGDGSAVVEIDWLCRYPDRDITVEGGGKNVSVLDGRKVYRIEIADGEKSVIRLENGAVLAVRAEGDAYEAVFSGLVKPELDLGKEENLAKKEENGDIIVSYTPKVIKTCFNSVVLVDTQEASTDTISFAISTPKTENQLHGLWKKHDQTVIFTLPSSALQESGSVQLHPGEKAELTAYDGTVFELEYTEEGLLSAVFSAEVDGTPQTQTTVQVEGEGTLPDYVGAETVIAKTYARNSTASDVLHITVDTVKNEALPEKPGGGQPGTVYGSLELLKIDGDTGKPLPGAEFEILNEDQETIFTGVTGSDGKLFVGNLRPGTYFYREIKAPEGYLTDEEVYPFAIRRGITTEITAENQVIPQEPENPQEPEKPENPEKPEKEEPEPVRMPQPEGETAPQTGDETEAAPFVLLLLSVTALSTVIGYRRKQRIQK